MWWDDHGMTTWDAWPAMILMMTILAVVVTVVVMLVIQSTGADTTHGSDARRILDARLAKGEIDPEEYDVRREALSRPDH